MLGKHYYCDITEENFIYWSVLEPILPCGLFEHHTLVDIREYARQLYESIVSTWMQDDKDENDRKELHHLFFHDS